MEQTTLENGTVLTHHDRYVCEPEICPIHNPTDHEYRQYPLDWDTLWGVMVRRIPVEGGVTTVIDPDEYKILRLKKGEDLILENAVKCFGCKERIVSMHCHDYVMCACGNVAVDGGREYLRRVFQSGSHVEWADDSVIYTKES